MPAKLPTFIHQEHPVYEFAHAPIIMFILESKHAQFHNLTPSDVVASISPAKGALLNIKIPWGG